MRARIAIASVVALTAQVALASHGSHSGHHSSSHHSGGHHSGSHHSSSHGSSGGGHSFHLHAAGPSHAIPHSPSSSSRSAAAEQRHPRPRTGSFYRYAYGYRRPYPYYGYRPDLHYGLFPSFNFYYDDAYPYYRYDYGADGVIGAPDLEYDGLPNEERPDDYGVGPRRDVGELQLEVRPDDASVYVDGVFKGLARDAGSLTLPEGSHMVEVVRPGFRAIGRDVQIRGGEPARLEVDLERE